jgi:hypothetical protein
MGKIYQQQAEWCQWPDNCLYCCSASIWVYTLGHRGRVDFDPLWDWSNDDSYVWEGDPWVCIACPHSGWIQCDEDEYAELMDKESVNESLIYGRD